VGEQYEIEVPSFTLVFTGVVAEKTLFVDQNREKRFVNAAFV
jgi:hypothetical protein